LDNQHQRLRRAGRTISGERSAIGPSALHIKSAFVPEASAFLRNLAMAKTLLVPTGQWTFPARIFIKLRIGDFAAI